ncbi:hypothetical protein GCM10027570_55290 [Streptomonospora sediminis]
MPEVTAPSAATAAVIPKQPTAPCPACAHPPCRTRRSAAQTSRYGRTAEFALEHRTAAAIQAQHPNAVVWFGQATQSYWAATPTGFIEAPDADTLIRTLWASTGPGAGHPDPARTSAAGSAAPAHHRSGARRVPGHRTRGGPGHAPHPSGSTITIGSPGPPAPGDHPPPGKTPGSGGAAQRPLRQ